MKTALIRVLVGIGIAIGGVWYLNKALAGTQFEWLPIVFVTTVVIGTFVSMNYSETSWYKRFNQFTKKYLVWGGIALIAGLAIWNIISK